MDLLLAHKDFVAAVARRIAADPSAADDIEQNTWLSAIERPPASAFALRAWFGTVARHYAFQAARASSRRKRRETAAARTETAPDALAQAMDTERRHRVVQAVLDLDETHRSMIIARYFLDLSPAAIALRDGLPVETVKTRLKRALLRLRARLEP